MFRPHLLLLAGLLIQPLAAHAYVALMAGQQARPLDGRFNTVPVLHSNQPEEVEGPGILISTTPGMTRSSETGLRLANPEFTFNGDFGVHLHHKYDPSQRRRIVPGERRSELSIALILINPGQRPVRITFSKGAVRNSFEAPYLANNLLGVKPLGPRPWNTGPGDATAVQLLRGRLDPALASGVVLPGRSRLVLFQKTLPALGIANGLLSGHSDGPFQMAVVATRNPSIDQDALAILDQGQLAPGRVYLQRIAEINSRQVFSRVGGVALGDHYQAQLSHDLSRQGPLHVPLTSTHRHHFGTREVQVNPLATRMIDSALDNVGTYGVRYDIDLNLYGSGPYVLVMSHPLPEGGMRPFVAFRGSLQIRTSEGQQDLHVGLRSGESLSLTTVNLKPGVANPVRLSLVYPADATPGHLLSVVPASQLARVQAQRGLPVARSIARREPVQIAGPTPPPPLPRQSSRLPGQNLVPGLQPPARYPGSLPRGTAQQNRPSTARRQPPEALPEAMLTPMDAQLLERYQRAVEGLLPGEF